MRHSLTTIPGGGRRRRKYSRTKIIILELLFRIVGKKFYYFGCGRSLTDCLRNASYEVRGSSISVAIKLLYIPKWTPLGKRLITYLITIKVYPSRKKSEYSKET